MRVPDAVCMSVLLSMLVPNLEAGRSLDEARPPNL